MKYKILKGVRTCSCCGRRILFQGYDTQTRVGHIMERDSVCYECAYWKNLADHPPECFEVVGRQCYRIYPMADKKDKTLLLGGGTTRNFSRFDLTLFRSNDVWLIGAIPERFLSLFPPTAVEISYDTYKRLLNSPRRCRARGCFDRYNCLRFNRDIEADGPFNKVPANWKVGGERCRSFININKYQNGKETN